MSQTGLILAFYRDHSAATQALAALRKKGFRRTATLHRKSDDRFTHNRGGLPSGASVVLGGTVGALISRYLPLPRMANTPMAPAIGAVAGAAAGYLSAQGVDGGLPEAILNRQRQWLLRGDTVLVAQAAGDTLSDIMEVLRQSGHPAVYVLRGGQKFGEEPSVSVMRGENFSSDQLREVARRLAVRHHEAARSESGTGRSHARLIERLKDNHRVIAAATQNLIEAARLEIPVSIAAEWLLDNGYIVEVRCRRCNLASAEWRLSRGKPCAAGRKWESEPHKGDRMHNLEYPCLMIPNL